MTISVYAAQAARYDDLDDLKGLESAGVSLDSKDSQGRTGSDLFCLHCSAFLYSNCQSDLTYCLEHFFRSLDQNDCIGLFMLFFIYDTCTLHEPTWAMSH